MLSQGSDGPDVSDLQTRLNAAMPAAVPLVIDGIFGPLTKAAVVAYQGQHALVTDGIVGPITWGVLDTPVPPPPPTLPTLAIGATGLDVAQAQQKLNVAVGPLLDIDGVYDGAMAASVFAFQLLHGITPTGTLDGATRVALNTAVPGGGTDAAGIENAVDANGGAHPLGTQVPGTTLHPVVGAPGMRRRSRWSTRSRACTACPTARSTTRPGRRWIWPRPRLRPASSSASGPRWSAAIRTR
jgi:peptidoglycan hydrolase-like protein with peptidoglycan-binding domain